MKVTHSEALEDEADVDAERTLLEKLEQLGPEGMKDQKNWGQPITDFDAFARDLCDV